MSVMTQSPENPGGPPAAGRPPGDQDDSPPVTVPPPDSWHFAPQPTPEPMPPAEPPPGAQQVPPGVPAPPAAAQVPYGTSPHYGTPPAYGAPNSYGGRAGYGTQAQPHAAYQGAYAGGPQGRDPGLAEWWRRLLARLIDVAAVAVVLLPIGIPMLSPSFSKLERIASQYPDLSTAQAQSAFASAESRFLGVLYTVSLIAAAVWFVYDAVQHAKWGQTLGKRALSTRVVSAYDGSPVRPAAAVKRAAVYALIPVIPLLGTFFALLNELWLTWDRRRQCLHDKAARTVVVRTNVPGAGQRQPPSPW
jgi:uncharacterized RDD family membrane protein YckC